MHIIIISLTCLVNILYKGHIFWMIKFQNTFSQHILWQIAKKWHAFRIYVVQLTWCKMTRDKLWRYTCFSCIYIAQILNQNINNANKFFHVIFELFAAVYMRILFCWVMKLLHRVTGWGSISAGHANTEGEGSTFLQIIRTNHLISQKNKIITLHRDRLIIIGKHYL